MPFIPHTPAETNQMLSFLNLQELAQLFDEIPSSLAKPSLGEMPAGMSELAISRLMNDRAPFWIPGGNFIGAGAYEHHIPAAVWQIATRGEFYTPYTPYQAEASQGTLQLIYEFQTMIAQLMGMDIANASLYDGASALVEAVLMALRIKGPQSRRVIVPRTLHPAYRQVLRTILGKKEIYLEELDYHPQAGCVDLEKLKIIDTRNLAAIIIPQPNFFGVLEDVDTLTNFAHQNDALAIAVVNPLAMALLREPGQWGNEGVDIACGEGQPLGVPLTSGGPYFGVMCCRKSLVRQLPGRIVSRTQDAADRIGYTLTLQTREQHIRRAKANSNICTNQGLLVTAATIHMSILGAVGLRNAAAVSHTQARQLQEGLTSIPGVHSLFNRPIFHEFVLHLPAPIEHVLEELTKQGIYGGYALKADYPELGEGLLICATETKTTQDLMRYQQCLASSFR